MNTASLSAAITAAVNEYICNEEAYTDNVQVQINTETGETIIADPDNEIESCDYYPVMDLVKMSTANPGQWEADPEAIADVVAAYATE